MSREQQRLMSTLARRFIFGPSASTNGYGTAHEEQSCVDEAQVASLRMPQQQLDYLARTIGFRVQLTDFPHVTKMLLTNSLKATTLLQQPDSESGNAPGGRPSKGAYLSLVTLGLSPPQVVHGKGHSLEEARQDAARHALEVGIIVLLYKMTYICPIGALKRLRFVKRCVHNRIVEAAM